MTTSTLNHTQAVIELAKELIAIPSITPQDKGCQTILSHRLQKLGFDIQSLPFTDVSNFWARYGNTGPVFVFAGHTDVVPPGPLQQWTSNPFEPEIRNQKLYGRGAADMKSSLAAMVIASENFLKKCPKPKGSIAFLITSDEEGPAINGTVKVVEYLKQQSIKIDYCLVGEASSEHQLGDLIKIGRRGTLTGKLTIHGKQGHIAYPQLANNPIHKILPALIELTQTIWDQGNAQFPPTSFQISNIAAGTGADNVIPGHLDVNFNFRYCTENTAEKLQARVEAILQKHQLNYQLNWRHGGLPFLTPAKELVTAAVRAIETVCQISPELSTIGGTSDGRFIATLGAQVVEIGPINASIHQIDEHVDIVELEQLVKIYEKILEFLLG